MSEVKRTIKTELALDGETKFKAAMSNINKDFQVLSSELKNATAGLNKNNDAEKIAAINAEALSKKIEIQNKRISEIKNALGQAEAAYGKNSNEVKEYQIKLNNAEAALKGFEAELKDSTTAADKAGNAVKEVGDKTEKTDKEVKNMHGSMQNAGSYMSGGFKSALKGVGVALAATAAALIVVVSGTVKVIEKSAELGDELSKTSAQLGVSTDMLQEWNYAAIYTDVSSDTMAKGLAKTVKAMGSAQKAGNDFIQITDDVSVSMYNADGTIKSTQQAYYDSIDAIKGLGTETEKEIATQALFGKSYQEMMPLINAGSGALNKYAAEAQAMGIVLDEKTVKSLDGLSDSVDVVKMQLSTAGALFTASLMPMLTGAVAGISEIAGVMNSAMSDGFQATDVKTIGDAISAKLIEAVKMISTYLPDIIAVLSSLLSSIVGILVALLPTLIPALFSALTAMMQALIDALVANLQPLSDMIITVVMALVDFIVQNLPTIIQAGITILLSLMQGITAALPDLIAMLPTLIITIVDILLQNLPMIIQCAVQLLTALITGLSETMPQLVTYLPKIISTIVKVLIENLPMILDAAVKIITALLTGMIQTIPQLLTMGPQVASAIKEALAGIDMLKYGKDLIEGLAKGIKDSIGKIGEAAKGIADKISSYLHFSRPDEGPLREYETWMPDMIKGLSKGVRDNAGKFKSEIASLASGVSIPLSVSSNYGLLGSSSGGSYGGPVTTDNSSVVNYNITVPGGIPASDTDKKKLAQYIEEARRSAAYAKGALPA